MPEARIIPLLTESVFPATPVLIHNVIHFPLPWIASFARTLGLFLTSPLCSSESSLQLQGPPSALCYAHPWDALCKWLAAGGLAGTCAAVSRPRQHRGGTKPEPCAKGAVPYSAALYVLEVAGANGTPSPAKAETQSLPEKKSPFFWLSGCLP